METLPLAEQLLQYEIGISEVLAFMSAVNEKADMERTSRRAAAYKVVENRNYSELGLLKKEQSRIQQQIFLSNMFMATRQAALMSLMRLQILGVRDEEIVEIAQMINLDKLGACISKENGNKASIISHSNRREPFNKL